MPLWHGGALEYPRIECGTGRQGGLVSLVRADARQLPIADGVVHCCVTSPPYFGLRDYGAAGQIGLEATPAAYIDTLVAVFREVWRVLRDDGTCWVNLGDSFVSNGRYESDRSTYVGDLGKYAHRDPRVGARFFGLKSKDLMGIPWRVALALQADGWYLRSDIIWAKPNPMPESVTDRPTKSHEHLFLLTKAERYAYDAAAIAEAVSWDSTGGNFSRAYAEAQPNHGGMDLDRPVYSTRNKRDVWTITTQPYAGAHFATMPEALVEPCILAGCPLGGLVLDPFCGTFTVGAVAARLSRRAVGVDLSYQHLAAERTAQRGLMFDEATA